MVNEKIYFFATNKFGRLITSYTN